MRILLVGVRKRPGYSNGTTACTPRPHPSSPSCPCPLLPCLGGTRRCGMRRAASPRLAAYGGWTSDRARSAQSNVIKVMKEEHHSPAQGGLTQKVYFRGRCRTPAGRPEFPPHDPAAKAGRSAPRAHGGQGSREFSPKCPARGGAGNRWNDRERHSSGCDCPAYKPPCSAQNPLCARVRRGLKSIFRNHACLQWSRFREAQLRPSNHGRKLSIPRQRDAGGDARM
jgi:hypothetical protein